MRRMLGTFTAVTAALLVVGIAWAAGDRSEPGAALDVSTQAEAGVQAVADAGAGSTSVTGQASTSATVASSTTATTTPGSSTSTSVAGSTSTSAAGSTSTTIKEDFTSSSGGTFHVATGVSVTVEVRAGILVLADVSAPGWGVRVKDVRHDRIRIEFDKDGSDARFEARLDDGRLDIEIRRS